MFTGDMARRDCWSACCVLGFRYCNKTPEIIRSEREKLILDISVHSSLALLHFGPVSGSLSCGPENRREAKSGKRDQVP